jgi:hypothetical protein
VALSKTVLTKVVVHADPESEARKYVNWFSWKTKSVSRYEALTYMKPAKSGDGEVHVLLKNRKHEIE